MQASKQDKGKRRKKEAQRKSQRPFLSWASSNFQSVTWSPVQSCGIWFMAKRQALLSSHSACPSHTTARREMFTHIVEAIFHSFVEKSSKATGNAKVFPKLLSCPQMMILSNVGNGVVLLPSNSFSSPLTRQAFTNPVLVCSGWKQ